MIARLRGELVHLDGTSAIIDCHGVGYEVTITESALVAMGRIGDSVTLLTRHIFREDGQLLFGFVAELDRRVFDVLLEVKGCGPKVAMALLSAVSAEGVIRAVVAQDAKTLTAASGVGPRLAERIALETKAKFQEESVRLSISGGSRPTVKPSKQSDDVIDALLALGYRRSEVEAVLNDDDQSLSVDERIRLALRKLSRT